MKKNLPLIALIISLVFNFVLGYDVFKSRLWDAAYMKGSVDTSRSIQNTFVDLAGQEKKLSMETSNGTVTLTPQYEEK